jgi:antitoxin MazE
VEAGGIFDAGLVANSVKEKRIPDSTVEEMGLKEGGNVDITIRRKADVASPLARLRQFRGRMPDNFRFDREENHERKARA